MYFLLINFGFPSASVWALNLHYQQGLPLQQKSLSQETNRCTHHRCIFNQRQRLRDCNLFHTYSRQLPFFLHQTPHSRTPIQHSSDCRDESRRPPLGHGRGVDETLNKVWCNWNIPTSYPWQVKYSPKKRGCNAERVGFQKTRIGRGSWRQSEKNGWRNSQYAGKGQTSNASGLWWWLREGMCIFQYMLHLLHSHQRPLSEWPVSDPLGTLLLQIRPSSLLRE